MHINHRKYQKYFGFAVAGVCIAAMALAGLICPAQAQTTSAPLSVSLTASGFFGGSQFDRAQGVTVDQNGYIYIAGNTYSTDLPTTSGAWLRSYQGDNLNQGGDGYVAKFAPDGKSLIWATYIGGSSFDRAYSLKVDSQGYVYVTLWTASANFPTTPGAYQRVYGGGSSDVAIVKLKPDGSGPVWSTFLGGTGPEQGRNAIAVDGAGNVYISGWTQSLNYPVTAGAYQRALRGGQDAFITVLAADGSKLLYSTLLGGSGNDESAYSGIIIHSDGSIYVAGHTNSPDFPTMPGAYQAGLKGSNAGTWMSGDAFVVRLKPDLSGLMFSTYLGGSGGDEVAVNDGIAVDGAGNAVVIGNTISSDFPVSANAFQKAKKGAGIDTFVAKISSDGKTLLAATYIGATGVLDEASGVAVDSAGNIYFSGNTQGNDFPVTANALISTYQGGPGNTDAWFTIMSPDLTTLLYSTYLGGSGTVGGFGDRGREVILDGAGNAIICGDANSSDFPVKASAFVGVNRGNDDGFIAKFAISSASSSPTIASFSASVPTVIAGGASVLSWSVSGATSISISPGIGSVSGTSVTVSPMQTTTYTLTASNSASSVTAQATITVAPPSSRFQVGDKVQATANLTVRATASTGGASVGVESAGNQGMITGGSTAANGIDWWPVKWNDGVSGWSMEAYLQKAVGILPSISSVSVSPSIISPGQSATLSWTTTGATSITITPGTFTSVSASGSTSISPATTTTYTVTAMNSAGSVTAQTTVTVQLINVAVSPSSANLLPAQNVQFVAAVMGTANTAVTWSLNPGVGSLSSGGLYTAPASISSTQTVMVKASSVADPSKSASAVITLTPAPTVSVSINPAVASLLPSQNLQCTASVTGTANTAVTWSLSPAVGSLSSSGLYMAPASISSTQTVMVKASSVADPSKSASAVVTLTPATNTGSGNLLTDPGFENNGQKWTNVGFGGRSITTLQTHSGSKSLQISGNSSWMRRVYQDIPVSAGQTVNLSAWLKTNALAGGAEVSIIWLNSAGLPEIPAESNVLGTRIVSVLTGTQSWRQVAGTAVAPPSAKVARIQFCLYREADNSGAAWFDDAVLQ